MFTFKEYNPLKRTFTRAESENSASSSPSTPEMYHPSTPEVPKAPSLPSTAVRHASNALLVLGDYVSNAFQQLTASVSRSSRHSPSLSSRPLSLYDASISPSGLSFSSPDSLYNHRTMSHNRETTPTPLNHQATMTSQQMPHNPRAMISHRQTAPENVVLENDTRVLNIIHDDESNEYIPSLSLNINDPYLSDESDDISASIQSKPKKRGRKVNSTFIDPPQGEIPHPCIDWLVDKLSMEQYMHDYPKQEGFAVNALKERGGVIRWRCAHAGKYNDHRKLPVDVMDKNQRRELAENGIPLFIYLM
jgi:hypothetical protein